MLYKTHLLFAVTVYFIALKFVNLQSKYIFFILLILSSFIPDIDIQTSKISQKFKISSFIISNIFSHRNFFHSIIFSLLIYFIFANIIGLKEVALSLFLGISSHIFLDSFTIEGIALFSPFYNKKISGFIKTGGFIEQILFFSLILLCIYFVFF